MLRFPELCPPCYQWRDSGRDETMPAFLAACLAAIVIAAGAYVVLNQSGYVPDSAASVFSNSATRLGNG